MHKIYPEDETRKKGRNVYVYTSVQSTWVRKIPWRRKWQLTLVFLPGKSHGQRSLVGYSPRGHKESDTSEQLTHTHIQLGHAESSYTVPGKVNKGPVL